MGVPFGQLKKMEKDGNRLKQGYCHQPLEGPARPKLQVSLYYPVRKWKGGRKQEKGSGRRGRKDG